MKRLSKNSVFYKGLSYGAVLFLVVSLLVPQGSAFARPDAPTGAAGSTPVVPNNTVYQSLPFSQDWGNAGMITINDDWSGVPGIVGYLGDFLPATTPTGVDPQTVLGDHAAVAVDVIANQSNPATQAAGGVAEFDGIADPVAALQGSGTADAPFLLIHVNTTGLQDITISYNLRDIDTSVDNAIQPVALQYRLGESGNFTNVPAGFVADASDGPSLTKTTPVNVILPAAVNNAPQLQIRILTTNAVGSDEWIGIDDILITGTSGGGEADLVIDKTGPASTNPSATAVYRLAVTNEGGSEAESVVITDTLPLHVTYVDDNSGFTPTVDGQTYTWSIGTLAAGGSLSFDITTTVSADATGSLVNTAGVETSSPEASTSNNFDSLTTTVVLFDLTIAKSAPLYDFGEDEIVYTVVVTNSGTLDAENVTLTDTLPANVTYVSDDSGLTPDTSTPGLVVWNLGTLLSNSVTTIHITGMIGTLTGSSVLTNQVAVSTTTAGDDPSNNTASASTTAYEIVPIATARAGTVGNIYAVEGQVTVLPNTLSSREWSIQDASGGIAVYNRVGSSPTDLSLGDTVRVIGSRRAYANQEQLEAYSGMPYYYELVSHDSPVTPLVVNTGEVPAGTTEGWLIQFEGTVSNAVCPGDRNITVNDGTGSAELYAPASTGIDFCGMGVENGGLVNVVGFSTQYNAIYQVKPRSPADVQVIPPGASISKTAPQFVLPGEVYTYTLLVQNQHNYPLTGIVVNDTVPVYATYHHGGTLVDDVVSWTVTSLAAHASINLTFAVTASPLSVAIVNDSYSVSSAEYVTPTLGLPVTTFVNPTGTVSIHHLQGANDVSPFSGQTVSDIFGIVTQVKSNGFYMQEPDEDDDPRTSEGIFVFTASAPSVSVGDEATVAGIVSEYYFITQLSSTSVVAAPGTEPIEPTDVPMPVDETLEWFESMLVRFPEPMTIAQNYFLGRYGQLTLSSDGRMYTPNNGNDLGDTFELNTRRMVILDDNSNSENPVVVPYIDIATGEYARAGEVINDLTGIIDYGVINSTGARFYRLQPTIAPVLEPGDNPRPLEPEDVGGELTIASFNVLNYFNGNGDGTGFPTSRGADTYAEFVRQRTKIINAIVEMDADVIGLMEIENDFAGANPTALEDLVNGLNDATAPGTYAYVTLYRSGTDEIKVSMVYKPAAVTPLGSTIYDTAPIHNRPPMAQAFTDNASGENFVVVVNHFKSKGCSGATGLDLDQGDGQGCFNYTRQLQAAALIDFIETELEPIDPDVFVIGDLNAYGIEDPIDVLTADLLHDMAAIFVSSPVRYSYVFDGLLGYLDHALATSSAAAYVTDVTFWHINSDEATVLDYDQNYNPPGYYDTSVFRSSDHDPVLLGVSFEPVTAGFTSNTPVFLGETSLFTNNSGGPGNLTYEWDFGDGSDVVTTTDAAHVYASAGTYTVTLLASNGFATDTYISTHTVLSPPDLTIEKLVDAGSPVAPGEVVLYSIFLANSGDQAAQNVLVTDTLPAGITFGGWVEQNGATEIDGVITWNGSLPTGEISFVFTTTVNMDYSLYGQTITNTVEFDSSNAGSGSDSASFSLVAAPLLTIEKTVEPAVSNLGDVVTYTISLSNAGEDWATGISMIDTLPDGVTFNGWVDQSGAEYADGTITWLGDLVDGGLLHIIFTVTVDEDYALYGNTITNSVSFTSVNDGYGSDSAAFTIMSGPVLTLDKTVTLPAGHTLGSVVTYSLTLENSGDVAAVGIELTDVLPAQVDFLEWVEQNGAVVVDDEITWTGTLAAGDSLTLVFTAKVGSSADLVGDTVTNTASYTSANGGDGSDTASFEVTGSTGFKLFLPLILRGFSAP